MGKSKILGQKTLQNNEIYAFFDSGSYAQPYNQ